VNKVFVLAPQENWIVDRFKKEWDQDNIDISVQHPIDADVIWLLGDWCYKRIPYELLKQRKVITTIHHIVEEKFGVEERHDFATRDEITDVYHVFNERVLDFVKTLTDKPIELIHYWANQNLYKPSTFSKQKLRDKHGLPQDAFIVISAQRDTEGDSIQSGNFLPKLEKGADLFVDAIEKMKASTHPNLHCLLLAWRRQYAIQRLIKAKIPYSYFELPKHEDLCELMQCADLYIVASRCEGGPQSLIEAALLNVPVVSTPVGISEQVLPQSAINFDVTRALATIPNVEHMKLPGGYEPYRRLIASL